MLVLASHGAALAQLPAMPPLPQGPLPWPSTTGRRYKVSGDGNVCADVALISNPTVAQAQCYRAVEAL